MIAKLLLIAPSLDQLREFGDKHSLSTVIAASMPDGRVMCAAYPRYHHTRFALENEEGVVVLPGMHDPTPIGDLHEQLAHVHAKPTHTMREIALRLHGAHGPAFHPDT